MNLKGSKIGNVKVPVVPQHANRCIVMGLKALQVQVDMVKKLQAETEADLDALLPSVLDRAFKGEL